MPDFLNDNNRRYDNKNQRRGNFVQNTDNCHIQNVDDRLNLTAYDYDDDYVMNNTDQQYSKNKQHKNKPSIDPAQFGAFFVLERHIPLLLDIDMAREVAALIFEHGSSNKAIIALAHKLSAAAGDD